MAENKQFSRNPHPFHLHAHLSNFHQSTVNANTLPTITSSPSSASDTLNIYPIISTMPMAHENEHDRALNLLYRRSCPMSAIEQSPPVTRMRSASISRDPVVVGKTPEVDVEKRESANELREQALATTNAQAAQAWASDPSNPFNWPLWKRICATSIPALMAFTVTLGSSIYAPAIPDIVSEFSVSTTVALLGLSTWVLGLAFGPVLAAPLSEQFGRKAVYLISPPLSAAFTVGAGFSNRIEALIVCRFFGGFFGAPTLAVGSGTNADVWPRKDRAVAQVMFIFSPFAGPALGPIVGGYASQAKGWRWTQWPVVWLGLIIWLFAMFNPETHKKTILKSRAKRLKVGTPQTGGPKGLGTLKGTLMVTLFRPVWMIFTEPIVGLLSLYIAFNFSVLFGFFDAFPLVFEHVYGFDRGTAGLPWLSVLVGCLSGVATVIALDKLIYRKHYLRALSDERKGAVAPEHRLYAAMLGSLGLPIGLFWFGWTAREDVQWISPILAAIPFAWGNLCVFVSTCVSHPIQLFSLYSQASEGASDPPSAFHS